MPSRGTAHSGRRKDQLAADWRAFASEAESTDAKNQGGNTALHKAVQQGRPSKVKELINEGKEVDAANQLYQTPLHLAAWHGDAESMEILLSNGASTRSKSKTGKTPMHMASWTGHMHVLRLLAKQSNSTVHVTDKTGETPLHWAAWRGNLRSIEELLNVGADVEAVDQFGMTPLILAAQGGKHRALGKLLDRGADIYAVDDEGETALHWAAEKGNLKATRELLGRGAHTETLDERDRRPLHLAAHHGREPIVQELINHGADLGASDKLGLTPLHLGTFGAHESLSRLLLVNGADVHSKDVDGRTPLHLAAWTGSVPIIEDLLMNGADLEEKCHTGQSAPLHFAARKGNVGSVKALISKGASPEVENKKGRRPLHVAAKQGHLRIAAELLDQAVETSPQDAMGLTPLDIAIREGHQDIADLLRRKGGREGKGHQISASMRSRSPSPIRRDLSPQFYAATPEDKAVYRPKTASARIHEKYGGRRADVAAPSRSPSRTPSPYRRHPSSPPRGTDSISSHSPRRRLSASPARKDLALPPAAAKPRSPSPKGYDSPLAPEIPASPARTKSRGSSVSRSLSPMRRPHPGAPSRRTRSPMCRPHPGAPRRSPSPPRSSKLRSRSNSRSPPRAEISPKRGDGKPGWGTGMANAIARGLPNYSFDELKEATDDFSEPCVIGESNDGVTYLGSLDGKAVAIKVLNPFEPEVEVRFNCQVVAMGTASHPNLSLLLGLCQEEFCLMYEYANQGNLEQRLAQDDLDMPALTWKDRFSIAYDIIEGLNHLHNSCCPEPILHSNLVPSSIVLDSEYKARIAGASKAFLASEASKIPSRRGEFKNASVAEDVADLGILMMRIYTGDVVLDNKALRAAVEAAQEDDRALKVADLDAGNWPYVAASKYLDLAILCAKASREHRVDLEMQVLPKMRRLSEIYATCLPTLDKHLGSAYTVDIKPYPSKQASLAAEVEFHGH